jgi:hypothetical protein
VAVRISPTRSVSGTEMDGRDALPERLLRGPSRAAVDGHRNTAEPSGELSVGAVVTIGHAPLAVARTGWTRVHGALNEACTHHHGTHLLPAPPGNSCPKEPDHDCR